MRAARLAAAALSVGLCAQIALAQDGADPALVDAGRYLATAGDCAACHGENLAGGAPIASPMGDIYAANITPDATGIGGWTLAQFTALMREGEAPDGHIFPAMPYTSYTGLDDAQIAALYSYLTLGVEPVANVPPETTLPFPFVRPAMIGWNALFLEEGRSIGAVDVAGPRLERGRVLVESLAHCTACHTPRGQLMQPLKDRHLGGAIVDGWWAPNITSDPTGIGGWSDPKLAAYLTRGHVEDAVAAGEMSKVVALSLSRLVPDDIDAIVAYLRAVPAVASARPVGRAEAGSAQPLAVAALEPSDDVGWQAMLAHDTTQGALLYQSACATCHGIDGTGSAGGGKPSLRAVGSVAGPEAATLVQVIAHGVDRKVGDAHALMPGFRDAMDDDQIAALASYVRATFGDVEGVVDAAGVKTILDGSLDTPWLIRNAHWLSIAGIVAGLLVLILLAVWGAIRLGRRRPA